MGLNQGKTRFCEITVGQPGGEVGESTVGVVGIWGEKTDLVGEEGVRVGDVVFLESEWFSSVSISMEWVLILATSSPFGKRSIPQSLDSSNHQASDRNPVHHPPQHHQNPLPHATTLPLSSRWSDDMFNLRFASERDIEGKKGL